MIRQMLGKQIDNGRTVNGTISRGMIGSWYESEESYAAREKGKKEENGKRKGKYAKKGKDGKSGSKDGAAQLADVA